MEVCMIKVLSAESNRRDLEGTGEGIAEIVLPAEAMADELARVPAHDAPAGVTPVEGSPRRGLGSAWQAIKRAVFSPGVWM